MLPVVFCLSPLRLLPPKRQRLRAGRDRTPPLVRGARPLAGKDHSHWPTFSTIRLRMVVGITAPLSAVLKQRSARNSAGIGVPGSGVCHKCAAIFHAVQRIGFVPLFTACGGREGKGSVRTTAPPLLPSRNGKQKVVALFGGGHQPPPARFSGCSLSVSNAVNCSRSAPAPLCSISFAIAARRASLPVICS